MMSSSSSSLSSASFLPSLSQADVEQAAQLIQRTYAPIGLSPEDQKRLQQEIFDIQKRPEAWGLVVPFLNHQDSNVQFFGAHTAQVKIARDWASFPHEHDEDLRDTMIEITSRAIMASRNKVILRKLFVALTSLALLLAPGHPSRWPGWIVSCVTAFSNNGASVEHILDFLAIVAEEIDTAVLFGPSKVQLQQSLLDATPMVVQAITSTITDPQTPLRNLLSALKCLEAWLTTLPASDLTPLIAVLINLLISYNSDDAFVAISDTLQEIMSKSALSNGAGSRTLTEPLLVYLHVVASPRFDASLGAGAVDESLHSLCKLLVAIGDHSTSYIAANLASSTPVLIPQNLFPWALSGQVVTRGQLTQNFLRMMLSFTALPGWYGVDEDESEMTLSFWYLFQEALWSTDFEEGDATPGGAQEAEVVAVSKVVYSQLVQVLRRKTVWPSSLQGWTRDQVDKFQVYRRDVGDSLVNAYYILRDDMLKYYLDEVEACLNKQQANGGDGWEDAEAILHCIISIEESLDLEKTPQLSRLFSSSILGRIPVSGHHRIRRTTLSLISTYASWFPSQSTSHPASTLSSMLLGVVQYIVTALRDDNLSLSAANALKEVCDVNRVALAPHIAAFGELHGALQGDSVGEGERAKVLQSIASVVQALPPEEEIPALEAIVRPVLERLEGLMGGANGTSMEDRKGLAVCQIDTLSGVAKGLTKTNDGSVFEDVTDKEMQHDMEKMRKAREDERMARLRNDSLRAVRGVMELWSMDIEISLSLSEFFKAVTALPADMTLLTLPPGPIIELVCYAAQRQLTSIWLSLAGMLVMQMNPPSLLGTLKAEPTAEDCATVSTVIPIIVSASLGILGGGNGRGGMEDNPDIVRDFFGFVDTVGKNFPGAIFGALSGEMLDAVMACANQAMALQERYSVVAVCNFLATLVNQIYIRKELEHAQQPFVQRHVKGIFRSVLNGFAGVAPRSVTPNLTEVMSVLLSRCTEECRVWVREILYEPSFTQSKAGPEVKERFIKAIQGSRSMKKTREAANEFTLVARGLEGATFGYASVSM